MRSIRQTQSTAGVIRLKRFAFLLLPLSTMLVAHAQLGNEIRTIAARAHGRVGVACSLPGTQLDCNVNASAGLPMQSVYKLPIAIVALHAVEQGRLALNTPIDFRAADIYSTETHSPLRDHYPHANVKVPLEQLLRLEVAQSDNIACDLLLPILGGAPAVERSLQALGLAGIHVRYTEQEVAADFRRQSGNSASAAALVTLLGRLAGDSPLTPAHTALLLSWMTESPTGPNRIKGLLPAGTVVAHKTGTAASGHGTANAINDIGLITLPDGRDIALAVLVAASAAPEEARERVIAEIARAVYKAAQRKSGGSSGPSHE